MLFMAVILEERISINREYLMEPTKSFGGLANRVKSEVWQIEWQNNEISM